MPNVTLVENLTEFHRVWSYGRTLVWTKRTTGAARPASTEPNFEQRRAAHALNIDLLFFSPGAKLDFIFFPKAHPMLMFYFFSVGAGNNPASKITITLAFTSVTAGNRF